MRPTPRCEEQAAELISIVRIVIARRAVQDQPFLIVGMVAVIRRLSMVSAKAENLLDTPRFRAVLLASPSWQAQR